MYQLMGGGTIDYFDTFEQALKAAQKRGGRWGIYDHIGELLAFSDGKLY